MGLSLKHMHIFTRSQKTRPDYEIAKRVQTTAEAGPYRLSGPTDACHLEVKFGLTRNPSWLLLVDNGEFDIKEWVPLSKSLTKTGELIVITILVYDSDELLLNIFEAGRLAEKIKLSAGRRKKVTLSDIWLALMTKSTCEELRERLSQKQAMVDDHLQALVTALKLDTDLAFTDQDHIEEEVPSWTFQSLKFYLPNDSEFLWSVEEPPKFQTHDEIHNLHIQFGTDVNLYTDLTNTGRGSSGMSVIIPNIHAIQDKIRISEVKIATVHEVNNKVPHRIVQFYECQFENSVALRADLPDFEFGAETWHRESVKYEPWHGKPFQIARDQAFIWTLINIHVFHEPGVTFNAIFIPCENPALGSVQVTYNISKYVRPE